MQIECLIMSISCDENLHFNWCALEFEIFNFVDTDHHEEMSEKIQIDANVDDNKIKRLSNCSSYIL